MIAVALDHATGRDLAFADTYDDVADRIKMICKAFARKYGSELSEVEGEANKIFVECYHNCKPDLPFINWLMYKLKRQLFDTFVRYPAFRNARLRRVYTEEDHGYDSSFKLIDLIDELSEDGREVVKIALDNPQDVVLAAIHLGKVSPSSMRDGITEFLRDLGWSITRVQKAFNEVRCALSK